MRFGYDNWAEFPGVPIVPKNAGSIFFIRSETLARSDEAILLVDAPAEPLAAPKTKKMSNYSGIYFWDFGGPIIC